MNNRKRGFALLITITLLALLVLLLVSLNSLTRVETRLADNGQALAKARENALAGLNLAVGQLQKFAGPDRAVTARADGAPSGTQLALVTTDLEIPTMMMDGDDLLIRLFNASGPDGTHTLSIAGNPTRAQLVELDGRLIANLSVPNISLDIPRFGLRTLRVAGLNK